MKKVTTPQAEEYPFPRLFPGVREGLSSEQAELRKIGGAVNTPPPRLTRTIPQIVRDNALTLFNVLNLVLAALIIMVGSYKDVIFLGVAICNTAIGIFQEVRAKLYVDRLAIITQSRVTVVRDGVKAALMQEELVLDDIMYIAAGGQVCADAEVISTDGLEADESSLTGESTPVCKAEGDRVMSGSFIVSGEGFARVISVGGSSYASRITGEAGREKRHSSELITSLNRIIKTLAIVIIPLGAALFCSQFFRHSLLEAAVLGTAAAMIGLVPEGLVLLTGIALAVGIVNLSKRGTLVQNMHCMETLARADILCLDKTGTITDGGLVVTKTLPQNGFSEQDIYAAVSAVVSALPDDNPTARALRAFFSESSRKAVTKSPFSSARRWSGCFFEDGGGVIIGAPEAILADAFPPELDLYVSSGHRILAVGRTFTDFKRGELPSVLEPMGFILIQDSIRPEARATFEFFRSQGVTIKVISGDNAKTASYIALSADIHGAGDYIDMSAVPEGAPLGEISERHTVFGRVSPQQKKELIRAMKLEGHTVAMTGDGVNDVLALREADCGVSMASGSDAARAVSDFVLLSSNFDSMIGVVREGRRVVNNIERVAPLYLVKNIYTAVLTLAFIFLPLVYPFQPIQLTPITSLTVGIPSFFLALSPSYQRIRGHFMKKVFRNSVPAAALVVFNVAAVQIISHFLGLDPGASPSLPSTMCVLLTGVTGFTLLWRVSRPVTPLRNALLSLLCVVFVLVSFFFGGFFSLAPLTLPSAAATVFLGVFTVFSFDFTGRLIRRIAISARMARRRIQGRFSS